MIKSILLLILCFSNIACLSASVSIKPSEEFPDATEKFYVTADQILLANGKIYIEIENVLYETPAIFSDENGYYVEKIAKSGNCSWYEWKCQRCGYCNLRGLDFECRACQNPISN